MFIQDEPGQLRKKIEQLKSEQVFSGQHAEVLGQSIASSWQRSERAAIPQDRLAAPLSIQSNDNEPSLLGRALAQCADQLHHIAESSAMVIAVADYSSTIQWAGASSQMRNAAEKVHFIQGGQWREDLVGTNALALSLRTQRSSCVFSNEHYMSSIHDWVCYAAPIFDPYSKQIIGVVDLSTTWKKHNSLGVLAAERCAELVQSALLQHQHACLNIQGFGQFKVSYQGKMLALTPRQMEIVSILTLCPQGMNLEQLHQALYGERRVSMGTLKAEMSQLREIFGGLLGSRPYRLLIDIQADFLQLEQALDAGYLETAIQLYTGMLLAKTESPFLCAWRDCLESRLSAVIYQAKETDLLFKHMAHVPEAFDAVERLIELIPSEHPVHQRLMKYKDR